MADISLQLVPNLDADRGVAVDVLLMLLRNDDFVTLFGRAPLRAEDFVWKNLEGTDTTAAKHSAGFALLL